MTDTTVTKIDSHASPTDPSGLVYLASGKKLSMRMWREDPKDEPKQESQREYEVVGYVISGRAELEIEGQKVNLEPGNSWVVPAGAKHRYRILEHFEAVEATAPPFQVHGRDA